MVCSYNYNWLLWYSYRICNFTHISYKHSYYFGLFHYIGKKNVRSLHLKLRYWNVNFTHDWSSWRWCISGESKTKMKGTLMRPSNKIVLNYWNNIKREYKFKNMNFCHLVKTVPLPYFIPSISLHCKLMISKNTRRNATLNVFICTHGKTTSDKNNRREFIMWY